MYTFLTELDKRPDGIINSSVTARSSLAMGLALYYDRASKAVTSTQFTGVALTLADENGGIIENRYFETLYEAPDEPETEENDNSSEESQSLFSN